jgi:hypothetical protein
MSTHFHLKESKTSVLVRRLSKRFGSPSKKEMGNHVCIAASEEEKPCMLSSNSTTPDAGVLVSSHALDDGSSSKSLSSSSKHLSLRSVGSTKKAPVRFANFVGHAVANIGSAVEKIIFVEESKPPTPRPRTVRGGVLLHGCDSPEEHFEQLDYILGSINELELSGEEGLRAVGLELRHVCCEKHATKITVTKEAQETPKEEDATREHDDSSVSGMSQVGEPSIDEEHQHCDACVTRLVHKQTDTLIDHFNRKRFVIDGPMYDEVARFCMEYAHESMIEEGDLKWVQIDKDERGAINALVSSTHPAAGGTEASRPTLLVVTGKGKVRAGIFSRQHIQTTGLEPSTALFVIREAKKRNMNIIMLDPNARGEREAYAIIQKSMAKLFAHIENPAKGENTEASKHPLFVQAHSAAGSHVVRYLLDFSDSYLPHVRAMAFTDSTHNIQWTKKIPELRQFLESPASVYFRSSRGDSQTCKTHQAGFDITSTCDEHWRHRYGKIRTCWAGTTEHSLSDWNARQYIWEHFDRHLEL